MAQIEQNRTSETSGKVIYTAKTHTTGGRENGVSRSSDGRLDIKIAPPGSSRAGTNPEQLFAAGWSACFEGALALAAQRKRIKLSPNVALDAEVDLHLDNGEYYLSARMNVAIPDIQREVAEGLLQDAKAICPYSKATQGNIDVTYNLI